MWVSQNGAALANACGGLANGDAACQSRFLHGPRLGAAAHQQRGGSPSNQRFGERRGTHPCQAPLRIRQRTRAQEKRALEVDPIKPRHQGSSDELSTLQALSFRCMAASDRRREAGCGFCALKARGPVLLKNERARCIAAADPVTNLVRHNTS